ncbi:MAG: Crp/Fnr family transcriptional regulator [Tepidanaerobacteraceae bacterium]|nr:Crp/Fnr family transcriptional regulator [Tepidanaerobacteraceae bacterium]
MKTTDIVQIVAHTDLFSSFTAHQLLSLFRDGLYSISKYKRNNIIYIQNEKCNTMDVILEGELAVQKIDENGGILTISNFFAGDVVGGNLLFSRRNTFPMTITCKSDCSILHIKKELVIELCQNNKDFLIKFLRSISDKALILTDKIKFISMKTVRQRIIDYLTFEYFYQKSPVIYLNTSKKELAERFGIQRPSLSRELNKMRAEGLIEFDAKTITIKNLKIIDTQ